VPIAYIGGGVVTIAIGIWAAAWLRSMPRSATRPRLAPRASVPESSGLTIARPR
jgi:hypothetical protein